MSVLTYTNALTNTKEAKKGLKRTAQGGLAYEIDAFAQAKRFLVLGSDRPTYYASKESLTAKNVTSLNKALAEDGQKLVDLIVEISEAGRAPSNEPALVALAICASYTNKDDVKGAEAIRQYALSQLPRVARIPTHLFHFVQYADSLRGWGPSLRKGIANWYLTMDNTKLANQITKYQQRDGWSHADVLRMAHPRTQDATKNAIFKYIIDGEYDKWHITDEGIMTLGNKPLDYINAVEVAKTMSSELGMVNLIEKYNLPREVIPTQFLTSPKIWEALLMSGSGMPMNAMTRNVATMTRIGLLAKGSDATRYVIDRLHNQALIRGSKLHPIELLKAKLTYEAGRGVRGNNEWNPISTIVDSLESAFYLAFGNVEPIGESGMIALDVSGSMTFGELQGKGDLGRFYASSYRVEQGLAGVPGLSPRIAATVIAMVTARVERDCEIMGFTTRLVDLKISKHDSLTEAMAKTHHADFGGTDCALPFQYAMQTNSKYHWFAVYTDNETGYSNPSVAMRQYRAQSGIHDAKLIVNGMTSAQFSIADPTDRNMLDCVGFDSATPALISAFARGDI